MKTDLTQYGERELSMNFQNDESLYNVWNKAISREDFKIVKEEADEFFIYTPEQLEDLENDFNEEIESEKFTLEKLEQQIKEKDNKLYTDVFEDIKEDSENYTGEPLERMKSRINDILTAGCKSGTVSKLIYYTDTGKFYNEFKTEIWDFISEQAEQTGENVFQYLASCNHNEPANLEQVENFLSWLAYEEVSRTINDMIEGEE